MGSSAKTDVVGRPLSACPGCGKPVRAPDGATPGRAEPFPFCSFRCQMVDLGRWIDEEYRIADGEDQSGGGVEGMDSENPLSGGRSRE
jgi:uncharacterized protein